MSEHCCTSTADPSQGTPVLNALALAAIYSVAVFFAVAFSPNMGFISPPSLAGAANRIAMVSNP